MNLWTQRHLGAAMDAGGRWAASGQVDAVLLQAVLAEPFLAQPPPKSTGRNLFSQGWLDAHLAGRSTSAVDVQATLAELTARAARDALRRHLPRVQSLTVYVADGRSTTT